MMRGRRVPAGSEIFIRERSLEPELMDDPGLEPGRRRAALRGLARLNLLSLAGRGLGEEIRRAHRRLGRPVRVVDVAGGGGDTLLRAIRVAGVPVSALLVDISDVAIDEAQRRARRRGIALDVLRADVLRGPLPPGDLLACSLFLHHLDEAGGVGLLGRMRDAAGHAVLVNDLRLTPVGSALAGTLPRVVTRSRVVHTDAALSARAAWTPGELRAMAARASLEGAVVRRVFPSRMELVWRRVL